MKPRTMWPDEAAGERAPARNSPRALFRRFGCGCGEAGRGCDPGDEGTDEERGGCDAAVGEGINTGAEFYAYHQDFYQENVSRYQIPTRRNLSKGNEAKAADYIRSMWRLQMLRRTIDDAFTDFDWWCCRRGGIPRARLTLRLSGRRLISPGIRNWRILRSSM